MSARYSARDVNSHRHAEAPGHVDGKILAVLLIAQNDLRDDARAERDQDKSAQELRVEFPLQGVSFHMCLSEGRRLPDSVMKKRHAGPAIGAVLSHAPFPDAVSGLFIYRMTRLF